MSTLSVRWRINERHDMAFDVRPVTMDPDSAIPRPSVVLDLIVAFRRSKIMFAAVQLGVFDHLAGGPKSLPRLAASRASEPWGSGTSARHLRGAGPALEARGSLYQHAGVQYIPHHDQSLSADWIHSLFERRALVALGQPRVGCSRRDSAAGVNHSAATVRCSRTSTTPRRPSVNS